MKKRHTTHTTVNSRLKAHLTTAHPEQGEPEAMLEDFKGDYGTVTETIDKWEVMFEFNPNEPTIYVKCPETKLVSWGSLESWRIIQRKIWARYFEIRLENMRGVGV